MHDTTSFIRFKSELHKRFSTESSGTQHRTVWQLLHLDLPLLLGLLALSAFSLVILYSASHPHLHFSINRLIHIALAFITMFVFAQISPYLYQRWSPWLYTIGLMLLFIVLIMGHVSKGAQRWLNFGLFHIQPSEIMKLAVPMFLAWYYAHRSLPPSSKDLIITGSIIAIPTLLTAMQPDLGTALILTMGGLCILLFAGISWRLISSLMITGLISLPILWHVLHDYQKERILTFLNPERDPLGTGYHIIQSKIAIGSGGLLGKGWLQGSQVNLHFLPENKTDFIFAVCGEDFGLIGCLLLLGIYLFITGRCLYIASRAQDTYSRLLAGSLTLLFFLGMFINIGMVSGILPVVGLPLPLMSYGGSSMIATMACFGILMSIHHHRTLWNK